MFKKRREMTALLAAGAAAVSILVTPLGAEAKAAYNTKYSDTYQMAELLAPAFTKSTDPVGVALQLQTALRYGTITQGDIWLLYQNGYKIPVEALKLLADEGLISGYIYKAASGLPPTTQDLKDVLDADYYINQNPAIQTAVAAGTLPTDDGTIAANFLLVGMPAGLQGNASFNVEIFKANYPDLKKDLGDDNAAYYVYYIVFGKDKGMVADHYLGSRK